MFGQLLLNKNKNTTALNSGSARFENLNTASFHVTVRRGACTRPVIASPDPGLPYPTPVPPPQSEASLHPIIHQRLPRIVVCLRNRRFTISVQGPI
jgi:hypothetical protein